MSAPPLPGVLASLAPVLDNWGYLAVGGLVLIEDFGIPVPGETVLIAASVYAGAGRLNVVAVGLIALVAAVVGDNIGYAIGRFGGQRLISKYGRYVLLTPARVKKAEAFFTRHGGEIVVVARFIEGLRQANGIIAGLTRMPWRLFLAFNTLGAALWVATWVTIGDLAGTHIGTLYSAITSGGLIVLVIAAVLVAALIARHVLRRRNGGIERGEPAENGERPENGDSAAGSRGRGKSAPR
jgi:membrane protein DedA with SNARE-associated domain